MLCWLAGDRECYRYMGDESEGWVVQVSMAIHENCPVTPTTLNNGVVNATENGSEKQ
jgi:hypothetical protein